MVQRPPSMMKDDTKMMAGLVIIFIIGVQSLMATYFHMTGEGAGMVASSIGFVVSLAAFMIWLVIFILD